MATKTTFRTPVGTWTHTTLGAGPTFIIIAAPEGGPPYRVGWASTEEEAMAACERAKNTDPKVSSYRYERYSSKEEVPDREARKSVPGMISWFNK